MFRLHYVYESNQSHIIYSFFWHFSHFRSKIRWRLLFNIYYFNLFFSQRYRQEVDNRRWEEQLLEQPEENNQLAGNFKINISLYFKLIIFFTYLFITYSKYKLANYLLNNYLTPTLAVNLKMKYLTSRLANKLKIQYLIPSLASDVQIQYLTSTLAGIPKIIL